MLVFLNLFLFICSAGGARILGVVLTASYSHQIVFQPLWRELSLRGHQVTTLTSNPLNDPSLVNLTEIDLGIFLKDTRDGVERWINASQQSSISHIYEGIAMVLRLVDKQLDYKPVKDLINDKNATFDLVIVESLYSSVLAFAERFNCPSIGILPLGASNDLYRTIGNPTHSSVYPDYSLPFRNKLSLSERVMSFVFDYGLVWYLEGVMNNINQDIIVKHFGNNYPSPSELAKNISLLFINTDPIFHSVRPLVPAIVQIGEGSHRTLSKPLPTVLDDAKDGFIYFSLGSNIKSENLPQKTINLILEVFSELPYSILWKFGETILKKPENVFVFKWLPQEDVLAHPNIKEFITQGGLQSIDEAIYAHVPMVGMPFFADQPHNSKKIVEKGVGLEVDYKTMNKNEFKETILEVINNPKYKSNVKKLAELVQDQPMTGLEKAVWWTEYVLRHNGAKHLRSPLLDIPWYQYLLLDVIGVLLLVISMTVYLMYVFTKLFVRLVKCKFCTSSKSKEKKNKKL